MKHASHVEIEMKFRIPALEPPVRGLEAAGFTLLHPQGEERSVLWDRQGSLLAGGCALRMRRYAGRALITWKGPRVEDPLLKIRPELETAVEDPLALEGILAALGYAPVFSMVKSRSVWRRGALEACVDEAPFGCYLELEGTREEIREAMGQLGLAEDQVERRSYPALFQELG
jgi:adenylate cyclase class 2